MQTLCNDAGIVSISLDGSFERSWEGGHPCTGQGQPCIWNCACYSPCMPLYIELYATWWKHCSSSCNSPQSNGASDSLPAHQVMRTLVYRLTPMHDPKRHSSFAMAVHTASTTDNGLARHCHRLWGYSKMSTLKLGNICLSGTNQFAECNSDIQRLISCAQGRNLVVFFEHFQSVILSLMSWASAWEPLMSHSSAASAMFSRKRESRIAVCRRIEMQFWPLGAMAPQNNWLGSFQCFNFQKG